MNPEEKAEVRHGNKIYQCILDERWYNMREVKPYSIAIAVGVIPQQNQFTVNMVSQLICENCWKENQDDKGLHLKEPSKIAIAPEGALKPNGMLNGWGKNVNK